LKNVTIPTTVTTIGIITIIIIIITIFYHYYSGQAAFQFCPFTCINNWNPTTTRNIGTNALTATQRTNCTCAAGSFPINYICTPCELGYYGTGNTCTSCPTGYNTTSTGATNGLRGLDSYTTGASSAFGTSGTAITNGIHTIATVSNGGTTVTYNKVVNMANALPPQYWSLDSTAWHISPAMIQT
jgi:hypothetical protein